MLRKNAVTASKTGKVRFEVQPYASGGFPTAATQKQYQSKTVTGAVVGGQASAFFDLSGLNNADWQVTASFTSGVSGARSPWVRFTTTKVLTKPAGILNVEGESLVAAASAPVIVQPMQQFGSTWSGNAHLFWGGGMGATLTLAFDVRVAASYAAELYMTRAPDFGDVEVSISDLAPAAAFSGFAPQVLPSGPIQMGKFQLSAGSHTIRFRITGKYKDSKGYKIGFDRLRLYPG